MAADPRILTRPEPPEDRALPEHELVWIPCGTCWGQRRLFVETPLGYDEVNCPGCGGMGEVLR